MEVINYRFIKWIIFAALFLTIPAMFFFVMVVMFMPAVFSVVGIGYVIQKLFIHGHVKESLSFIVIFGLHALVYVGIYYGISVMVAKAITMIKNRMARLYTLVALILGLVFMTQFPIYGSGGHGPIKWIALTELLIDLNKTYGAGTAQIVYGFAILLCGILMFFKSKKKFQLTNG